MILRPLLFMLALSTLAACAARPDRAVDVDADIRADSAGTRAPSASGAGKNESGEDAPGVAHTAPHDLAVAQITTLASGDEGVAVLTFRTAEGVPISDEAPLRVRLGSTRTFRGVLQSSPSRSADADGTVVDQASYTITRRDLLALAGARTDSVTVEVYDGTDYVGYPYRSGNLIE